jgi:hypothetical protein
MSKGEKTQACVAKIKLLIVTSDVLEPETGNELHFMSHTQVDYLCEMYQVAIPLQFMHHKEALSKVF